MFAYSDWLPINILRRSFLMSFIMWSSHACRLSTMFIKQDPAAKRERMMICSSCGRYPGIFGAAVPPVEKGEVSWLSRATFSCRQPTGSEIVKSDVRNQYWNGRTTGHYNGKSHLAWDLVFTILLSRAPTARADAKFGFLEAGTQSTIIVYSFVKIWDTCPKCWRMEMFENSQIKHFCTFKIVNHV